MGNQQRVATFFRTAAPLGKSAPTVAKTAHAALEHAPATGGTGPPKMNPAEFMIECAIFYRTAAASRKQRALGQKLKVAPGDG
jgi:hypothetical protein